MLYCLKAQRRHAVGCAIQHVELPRAVGITSAKHRGRLRAIVAAHVPRDKTLMLMTCVLLLAVLIAIAALLAPWWPDGLATLPPAKSRVIRLARQDTAPGPARNLGPDGPQMLLAPNVRSLDTIAGPLTIDTTGSEDHVSVNGKRLALPGPRFALLSILRRTGQDIVLLGISCGGAACTYDELGLSASCMPTGRRWWRHDPSCACPPRHSMNSGSTSSSPATR